MQNNIIPNIVKKVMPAVVSIVISENVKDLNKEIFNPIIKGRLKEIGGASGKIEIGSGSGFIVDPSGIIITNRHIIADPHAHYNIITDNEKKFEAEIVARDQINDIAILKIKNPPKKHFQTIKLGDSGKLALGEDVLAFGNVFGIFRNTVSSGIISGLSRHIFALTSAEMGQQEMKGLIQTDAAINPGNSGGPLVNMNAEAIGINTVTVLGAENIGLAIPINAVKKDLADLKKYGRLKYPFLGIRYVLINNDIKNKFNLPVNYGAFIIGEPHIGPGVVKNSPAEKAGLKDGDIILEFNGEKISADKTISDFLEKLSVNDTIELKSIRGKKESKIKIKLAERK